MVATFNGLPSTTIIPCYSHTNTSVEKDLDIFINELSSLLCSTPKHNVLITRGDMTTQIGKKGNQKFNLHNLSKRNGESLTNFSLENCLTCLIWDFRKGKKGYGHHHHHHVVPPARISLTLSLHFSLSFITSGRSSGLHPVSSHSCCMYVRAGLPDFARP